MFAGTRLAVNARVVARAEARPSHARHAYQAPVPCESVSVSGAVDAVEEVRRIVVVLLAGTCRESASTAFSLTARRTGARCGPSPSRIGTRAAPGSRASRSLLALPEPRAGQIRCCRFSSSSSLRSGGRFPAHTSATSRPFGSIVDPVRVGVERARRTERRRISPSIDQPWRTSASCFATGRYGRTCAVESRSH